MSRITEKLIDAKSRGGGFIPFVTACDPDRETSLSVLLTLAELGADVIELGVPFSDPMADGPTIQRSSQRALRGGTTLIDVLQLATGFRKRSDVPMVVFSYFNPIMRFGLDDFSRAAGDAGVDGLLLTDIIDDEAAAIADLLSMHGIDLISLVAPTTSDVRLETICSRSRGFIYAVSRAGVTGARSATSTEAENLVQRTRPFTSLPIAVGFGISNSEQISAVWRYADAAVVGSAIVDEIEKGIASGTVADRVASFVNQLMRRSGADGQVAKRTVEN
ncbi:MAG TPA: tryptophan synthase subunit alpha [Pyrinomonadaceae bacterium]|nr:tryptophan synthase subunit alpha [Pyrinomonadaceae bacterium]